MRGSFGFALILTILLSSGYVYVLVASVCATPFAYRVGEIDERFNLTKEEAQYAALQAEQAWEEATGENLFVYDPEATFPINFVFDERQQDALARVNFSDRLDATENINDALKDTYDALVSEFEAAETTYEKSVASYDARLAAFNAKIQEYNANGGVPPEEFNAVQEEQTALNSEFTEINRLGKALNEKVDEINRLSEKSKELVENYNENVRTYNNTYGESSEITQGDYQGDQINIYKFIDDDELHQVLAHELGHALSLGHVSDPGAILHHQLEDQPKKLTITQADVDEYHRVCSASTASWVERFKIKFGLY